jgi:hypothetical protein
MSETWDIEMRLRQALAPVEPPADLEERLQSTLGSLVELAADELEAWELRAMKDPRNWPRATGAAAGLVVLRTRTKRHKRRAQAQGAIDLAERTLRDAGREALRVFRDVAR